MKTCIHTVILNEPDEYLIPWLNHHTGLVDHIFIHEDVGSHSHKHVTDRYDNVTLHQIQEKARQRQYIKDGVMSIQALKEYDWCFTIDIDEFITSHKPLESVLSDYQDRGGVLLRWVNYGASGHVYKPNYNDKDYRLFYTEKGNDTDVDAKYRINTKIAWNLHNTEEWNLSGVHFYDGDWVRIDDIYLKHYITKSWEEYVWKLYQRGMMTGFKHRSDKDFFQINPDMLKRYDELIEIKNKILKI